MSEWDCIDDEDVSTSRGSWAPGDTVLLTPGNAYVPFSVPSMANGTPITFRAKNITFVEGQRVAHDATRPIILLDNSNLDGPWMVGTGTAHWLGIKFTNNFSGDVGNRDLLTFGDPNNAATSVAAAPLNCVAKYCIFDGGTSVQQLRALVFGCNGATVHSNYFMRIAKAGAEPKAIGGTTLTGVMDIWNNAFDRCASTMLIHGSGTAFPYRTQIAQIIFEQNYVYWPTNWTASGAKSHIELKGWRNPRIVGNIFENYWPVGQANVLNFSDYALSEGWAYAGKSPFIGYNQFLHCPERLFTINDAPGAGLKRYLSNGLRFMHNFALVGRDPRNGNGSTNQLFPIFCKGVTIERNTILADQNISIYGVIGSENKGALGLRVNRNILPGSETGTGYIFASGDANHEAALNSMAGAGNWQCTGNAFGGTTFEANNPVGNTHLASNAALEAALLSDYSIDPNGALAGLTVGADMRRVRYCTDGVESGVLSTRRLQLDSPLPGFKS